MLSLQPCPPLPYKIDPSLSLKEKIVCVCFLVLSALSSLALPCLTKSTLFWSHEKEEIFAPSFLVEREFSSGPSRFGGDALLPASIQRAWTALHHDGPDHLGLRLIIALASKYGPDRLGLRVCDRREEQISARAAALSESQAGCAAAYSCTPWGESLLQL